MLVSETTFVSPHTGHIILAYLRKPGEKGSNNVLHNSYVETYLVWHKNRSVWVQAQVSRDYEQKFLFFSSSRAYPALLSSQEPS